MRMRLANDSGPAVGEKISIKEKTDVWLSKSGVKTASDPGVSGQHPHILSYEPKKMWKFRALCFARDLTTCYSVWTWLGHTVFVLYALLLMLVVGYNKFPDGEFGGGPACGSNGPNHQICKLAGLLDGAKSEFRFLIAFILAGFVSKTVDMWRTRRQNYGARTGSEPAPLVMSEP